MSLSKARALQRTAKQMQPTASGGSFINKEPHEGFGTGIFALVSLYGSQ
jgi:hypothetical protein